jgi:hypothetical protein
MVWINDIHYDLKQALKENKDRLFKIKNDIFKNKEEMSKKYKIRDEIENKLQILNEQLIEFYEEFFHSNK